MISVREVIGDPDMTAPLQWTILRSTGAYVLGGYQSTPSTIYMFGPVQQAALKDIAMLSEADRVGSIFAFWSTIPIHVTNSTGASDILVYEGDQYRVLQSYHDPGCGYFKALATRLRAA